MHFAHIMLLRHQARPPETKLRAGVDWIKTNGFACKIEGLLCPRQVAKNSRVSQMDDVLRIGETRVGRSKCWNFGYYLTKNLFCFVPFVR
jgi:hypothetical protein